MPGEKLTKAEEELPFANQASRFGRKFRQWFVLPLVLVAGSAWGQTICIDPGHPSEVGSGTRGKTLTEIKVAWLVAQDLATTLRKHGLTVVLTKSTENQKVLNRDRAEKANRAQAALMIRLHCDAGSGTGYAVYYPSTTGTVDKVTGPANPVLSASKLAATKLHSAMVVSLQGKLADQGLKTDHETAVGAKQGALTGSIYSRVPVVLVEMVVLTNPKDEVFIASKSGRAAMVNALSKGVLAAVRRE